MRHLNCYIVLTTLLLSTLPSEAVQLGSAKGSAVFGRPLDLSVQIRLDTPSEEATNCFSADVFQADNKFDAGRVRIDVVPAANGLDATVRVRSATAVSEPWAKVILRSNCGAKVSRQYDFLTDFATGIPAGNMLAEATQNLSATTTSSASAATTTVATSGAVIAQAPASSWNTKLSQAKVKVKVKVSQQKPTTQTAQGRIATQKAKSLETAPAVAANGNTKATEIVADAMGQSRLKMETFELTDEHQVLLKLSAALVAPTGMRTPEEIQALAQATAVWRAINGMPPEVKTTGIPAVDVVASTQVKAPTVATPSVAMPTLMKQKLAGKSEFSNLIVYGLIGLLALTLGCIALLWLRVRKATRAGYDWLNDPLGEDAVADHEQTQFLHSKFYETEIIAPEALEPVLDTEPEPEPEPEQIIEPETVIEAADLDNKISPIAAPVLEIPVVHSLPAHFDDPRFDERVLRVKKKNRHLTQEEPITSSAELMDLVLSDTPPKLRSVATPTPEPRGKPNFVNTSNAVKAKDIQDDPKGNLIDFDVFAAPEPLNKPTRFVR